MSDPTSIDALKPPDCTHDTLLSLREVEEDFPASQCLSCLTVFEEFPDKYLSFTGGQICYRIDQLKKTFVWDLIFPDGADS